MSDLQMPIELHRELLRLADVVHAKLVLYGACHAPRERYYDGANAFWAMVHLIAGKDDEARKAVSQLSPSAQAILAEAAKNQEGGAP